MTKLTELAEKKGGNQMACLRGFEPPTFGLSLGAGEEKGFPEAGRVQVVSFLS
jgi:hypothetical protein